MYLDFTYFVHEPCGARGGERKDKAVQNDGAYVPIVAKSVGKDDEATVVVDVDHESREALVSRGYCCVLAGKATKDRNNSLLEVNERHGGETCSSWLILPLSFSITGHPFAMSANVLTRRRALHHRLQSEIRWPHSEHQ